MSSPNSDFGLIVTGAGGWLGLETVRAAANRAAWVFAVYRTSPAHELPSNAQALIATDLATEQGSLRLQQAVMSMKAQRLALIHCAGMFPPPAPLHSMPFDSFAESLAGNATTFYGAVRALIPSMRRNRHGRLIAFSAHTRKEAYPYFGAFNAGKAALEAAVHTAAHENARFNISANTISVATLQTEEERRIKPAGQFNDWLLPRTVSEFALDLAFSNDVALNGSTLEYWRHSESFFGSSVFERNSINRDEIDPE